MPGRATHSEKLSVLISKVFDNLNVVQPCSIVAHVAKEACLRSSDLVAMEGSSPQGVCEGAICRSFKGSPCSISEAIQSIRADIC